MNGTAPVRKLSCQILGGMVVMAPPAWSCSLSLTRQADLHARTEACRVGSCIRAAGCRRYCCICRREVDLKEARGAVGAFGDGRVDLPAEAVVEGEAVGDLPGVLGIDSDVVAGDGGRADVMAAGDVRRRDGDGVDEGTAGEESWRACQGADRRV